MALQMQLAMRVNRMEFMPAVSCHDHSHANPTGVYLHETEELPIWDQTWSAPQSKPPVGFDSQA